MDYNSFPEMVKRKTYNVVTDGDLMKLADVRGVFLDQELKQKNLWINVSFLTWFQLLITFKRILVDCFL